MATVTREQFYLYIWSIATPTLIGTRKIERGAIGNQAAKALDIPQGEVRALNEQMAKWKGRVKSSGGWLELLIDPERLQPTQNTLPKSSSMISLKGPSDDAILSYLRAKSVGVRVLGKEIIRTANPIPKLEGKFPQAQLAFLCAAIQRLGQAGKITLRDIDGVRCAVILSQPAPTEVRPEEPAIIDDPEAGVTAIVPATKQSLSQHLRASYLLPHEMLIWTQGILPQLGEMIKHPEQEPWFISSSPIIKLDAEMFARHFGPNTFADALRRYEQASVLISTNKVDEFKFALHPKRWIRIPIDKRWVYEGVPLHFMPNVQTVRESCTLPESGGRDAFIIWCEENLPDQPPILFFNGYADYKPKRMPRGPNGLIALVDDGFAPSTEGLSSVDYIPATDPDSYDTEWSVWSPPDDINVMKLTSVVKSTDPEVAKLDVEIALIEANLRRLREKRANLAEQIEAETKTVKAR